MSLLGRYKDIKLSLFNTFISRINLLAIMDDEIFHFEDDDEYQTSNGGERDEEIENQTWEGRNKRQIDPEEQASRNIPADLFMK